MDTHTAEIDSCNTDAEHKHSARNVIFGIDKGTEHKNYSYIRKDYPPFFFDNLVVTLHTESKEHNYCKLCDFRRLKGAYTRHPHPALEFLFSRNNVRIDKNINQQKQRNQSNERRCLPEHIRLHKRNTDHKCNTDYRKKRLIFNVIVRVVVNRRA